jgi:putative transposase
MWCGYRSIEKKALYGSLRKHLGALLRDLAMQKESRVLEGNIKPDHVHMLVSIPPKYAVSQIIGFIKGKSAIHIARTYMGRRKNFTGQHFGPGATLCRPWERMKKQSVNISRDRKKTISDLINSTCLNSYHL